MGWFLGFTSALGHLKKKSVAASHLKDILFPLACFRIGNIETLAFMPLRGHLLTLGGNFSALALNGVQGGIFLHVGDCPVPCVRVVSTLSMPEAPIAPVVKTTNVSRHHQCPLSGVQTHPPLEDHWTRMMECGGGRALCSCFLFLFTAKWKPGPSCQPRVCRISGLASQCYLLTETTSPPLGDQGI